MSGVHAYAEIIGGPMIYLDYRPYLRRYFHISAHWATYRNLKMKILSTGFLVLALMFQFDKFMTNVHITIKFVTHKVAIPAYISLIIVSFYGWTLMLRN